MRTQAKHNMLGKLLDGRYQVVRDLSGGGFGKTYVAQDTRRPGHPECVVKHLKPTNRDPHFLQTARRLFLSEAETLEKLGNHDQIPRLLAYFEEGEEFFLVQEFIEGHTLSAELSPGQPWPESKVVQLLQGGVEILNFVHGHGVIHRDVKPNNLIRRCSDDRLALVDFGTVKQIHTQLLDLEGLTNATVAIGTPGYMPTEQSQGKPRFNSDFYALGMIGIQTLTGLNPQQIPEDPNTGEIIWQSRVPVTDELVAVLTKMVRYHFKDRYQSATELLQALQPLVTLSLPLQAAETALSRVKRVAEETANSKESSSVLTVPLFQPASVQNTIPVAPAARLQPKEQPLSFTAKTVRLWIGIGTAVLLGAGLGYTYWQWQSDHDLAKLEQRLSSLETLKAEGNYKACREQAKKVPRNSQVYAEAQKLSDECRLAQAQQFAASDKLPEALVEVGSIEAGSPVYESAQQLSRQWSARLLAVAAQQYQQGQFDQAIAMAQKLPAESLVQAQATRQIDQWRQEWRANETRLSAAQQALDAGNWQIALNEAEQVSETPFWQEKVGPIVKRARSKIEQSSVRRAAPSPSRKGRNHRNDRVDSAAPTSGARRSESNSPPESQSPASREDDPSPAVPPPVDNTPSCPLLGVEC